MKAIRKDFKFEIEVRKMDKDEMPDDGITYYCDDETCIIYEEDELEIPNKKVDTKLSNSELLSTNTK